MMRVDRVAVLLGLLSVSLVLAASRSPAAAPKALAKLADEKSYPEAPPGLKLKVRVMVPQDQETDLLFLCFFKHKEKGDTVLATIQKLDEQLGGLIAALRNRGEFSGNELETILITPTPESRVKAKKLMLIGLGEEDKLSLPTMRRIGTVALREAARLGVKRAAFGAAIRDQGNDKYNTGDVGREVILGMLLALDTEKRLQNQGLGAGAALEEWIYLAGPQYFRDVVPRVGDGVTSASAMVNRRSKEPYSKRK